VLLLLLLLLVLQVVVLLLVRLLLVVVLTRLLQLHFAANCGAEECLRLLLADERVNASAVDDTGQVMAVVVLVVLVVLLALLLVLTMLLAHAQGVLHYAARSVAKGRARIELLDTILLAAADHQSYIDVDGDVHSSALDVNARNGQQVMLLALPLALPLALLLALLLVLLLALTLSLVQWTALHLAVLAKQVALVAAILKWEVSMALMLARADARADGSC